jgi:hypothetical protein
MFVFAETNHLFCTDPLHVYFSFVDVAFLEYQERKCRGARMPVSSNAYPSLPVVLFADRTDLALETQRVDYRKPKLRAAEL